MKDNCELCAFNNPKCTVTAVIIRDGKILLIKRAEEPFKGKWDFPGGYLNHLETPEQALKRELKEELDVEADLCFIISIPGTSVWKDQEFAILCHFYLADLGEQDIKLNRENSSYGWVRVAELNPREITFAANQEMAGLVKEKFNFDLERVRELMRQLDSSAVVKEQVLYRAVLNGHLEQIFDNGKLIGMGWIFLRQTALRKQAVIEDMIMDEAYRGRGLGKAILEKLVKWAAEQGVEMIELTSSPKRIAANELYKKFGFELHTTNHYLYKVK